MIKLNCKNLKIRTKKGKKFGYCILLKKEVPIFSCNCNNKEFKQYKSLKSRSNKQIKKEKERFSIIYQDLSKCCVCGLKTGDFDRRLNIYTRVEKNEIFSGSYRSISIEDGMVAPMCIFCHKLFHKDTLMNLLYKVKFQKEYLKEHTREEFINRYGQDFIYKLEKIRAKKKR